MTVTYTRYEKEPVILIAYEGDVDPTSAEKARVEVAAFQKARGGMVFRLIDFTKAKIDFSVVALGMAADRGNGGIDDPNVTSIFIGSQAMVKMGVNAFKEQKRYGAVNAIHLVTSLDEAMALVKADLPK